MNLLHILPPVSLSEPCGADLEVKAELAREWEALTIERDTVYSTWDAYRQPQAASPPPGVAAPPPDAGLRPPDWLPLQGAALDLAARTKNMRVAVILTECLTHTEGLAGLRDGLLLITAWSATWWDYLHPGFSDKADLELRTEIVELLNHEKTIKRFDHAAELDPAGFTSASAREVREVAIGLMQFYETKRQYLSLTKLVDFLERFLGSTEPGKSAPVETRVSSTGIVDSRDSASQLLSRVIAYFRSSEPSSPVPYLLQRAQRCIGLDYIKLVEEIGGDLLETDRVLKPAKPQSEGMNQ